MKDEQQILAIILFGDIRNFRNFCDRVGHPESEFLPFWRDWQNLLDEFNDQTKGFFKKLADGLMLVKEVRNPERDLVCMLNKSWAFMKKANKLIDNKMTPKPSGFRLRMTFGYIWKHPCKIRGHDYVSANINLCEKMLHVHEDERFICHQSVIERLSKGTIKKKGFEFKKLDSDHIEPNGITRVDLLALWKFKK